MVAVGIRLRQFADCGGQRVSNLGAPSATSDAATKGYVDAAAYAIRTVTANYTATASDRAILANGSGITVTLPSASTAGAGANYWVKNINATAATLASGGGTIDGSVSAALRQWQSLTVVSDGANWFIL